MRPIFITIISVLIVTLSYGQEDHQSSIRTKEDYIRKAKHQRTAGLILTGAGSIGLAYTLVSDATQVVAGATLTVLTLGMEEAEYRSYTAHYITSAACLVTGIAFLVAAGKSKRKAKDLSFYMKMESITKLQANQFKQLSYPSAVVRIHL